MIMTENRDGWREDVEKVDTISRSLDFSTKHVWNPTSRVSSFTQILLSQRQILGTGNLPQDSAPVCINIDISPEMAAQSAQRNQAFCFTASDWSQIHQHGSVSK